MSKETKTLLRSRFGYCKTCPDIPVLLFDIRKSRLNPLWSSKQPRTVEGESLGGKCLKCNPRLDPRYREAPSRSTSSDGLSTPSLGSRASSWKSTGSSHTQESQGNAEAVPASTLHFDGGKGIPSETSRSMDAPSSPVRKLPPRAHSFQVKRRPLARSVSSRRHFDSSSMAARSTAPTPTVERASSDQSMPSSSSTRKLPPRSRSEHPSLAFGTVSGRRVVDTVSNLKPPGQPGLRSIPAHAGSGTLEKMVLSATDQFSPNHTLNHHETDYQDQPDLPKATAGDFAASDHGSEFSFSKEALLEEQVSTDSLSFTETSASARGFSDQKVDETVTQIKALAEDLISANSYDVLAEILVNSMKANSSNESVQQVCMQYMTDAFQKRGTHATRLVSVGAHKVIVNAMKTYGLSLPIQQLACTVLTNLAANKSIPAVLARVGVCDYISKAMSSHIGDDEIVASAVATLRTLSLEPEARASLRRLAISQQTIQAMQCHLANAAIQQDGCALLSNLAIDLGTQQVRVVDEDTLAAVFTALKLHRYNGEVVASACFALKNFTYEESNLRSIRQVNDAFELLQQAGGRGNMDANVVLERLELSLAEDESLEEQARDSLFVLVELQSDQPQLISEVIDVLKIYEWSPRMTAVCVKVLRQLMAKSSSHARMIRDQLAPSDLWARAEMFSDDQSVIEEVAMLVECMKSNDDEENLLPLNDMGLPDVEAQKQEPIVS